MIECVDCHYSISSMKFHLLCLISISLLFLVRCDIGGENQGFKPDGLKKIAGSDHYQDAAMFENTEHFGSKDKGNFFMDMYSLQTGPKKIEFGHVFEDPNTWEQRYEKKDHENNRFQGQARWGDKHGRYGEHYWDFNHGGDSHHISKNIHEP